VGHVSNALPLPFSFPTIAGGVVTGLGSFNDLSVVYDSDVSGPFMWSYTSGAWSPMGFAALGGTSFVWNGVDDLAFFITFGGASGGATFHRTTTEPFRAYASGYLAAASTGTGAAGAKMRFDMTTNVVPMASLTTVGTGRIGSSGLPMTLGSLQLPFIGNPTFTLDVAQGPALNNAYLFASFGISPNPASIGGGCFIYLDLATLQMLINQGFSPIGPLGTGPTGATSFSLPIPPDPGLAGFSIAFQVAVSDNTPLGLVLSNAVEAVIN
jgi:hypothetical protein